jgi:two-component system, OmpR family, response regulator VanR
MCSAVSPASETDKIPPRPTILCVDDSENMLVICKAILEASGYTVFTASNGQAALAALRSQSIDLAVIDNRMPGMTGVDLAKEIKRTYNLPVLMFSDSDDQPLSASTVDVFLNKRSGPRALCNAVGMLLARSRGAAQ